MRSVVVSSCGVLVLLLAGCFGAPAANEADEGANDDGGGVAGTLAAPPNNEMPDGSASGAGKYPGLQAPRPEPHALGTTWTYAATGGWDLGERETVVVAQMEGDGYLFAAASREDLHDTIIWGRPWHGNMDANLNPTAELWQDKPFFDWPLVDGKNWTWGNQIATARSEDVPIIGGTEPGFRVSVAGSSWERSWTYAPSVGWLTSSRWSDGAGDVYEEILLQDVSEGTQGVWYEPGAYGYAGAHSGDPVAVGPNVSVERMTLADGYDEIVFIGLGLPGTTGTVHSPAAPESPWTYEGAGYWEWSVHVAPAEPGEWAFTHRTTEPDTSIGVEYRSVKWNEGALPLP